MYLVKRQNALLSSVGPRIRGELYAIGFYPHFLLLRRLFINSALPEFWRLRPKDSYRKALKFSAEQLGVPAAKTGSAWPGKHTSRILRIRR
jgi:hypothetical protein